MRHYPGGPPPALGTVRRWLKRAEAEGMIERKGVEYTGKPGRPAHLWGLPEAAAAGKDGKE
jgi:predicted ArsR family transcriptional regulator